MDYANHFLRNTGSLQEQVIRAAQELIGHRQVNLYASEWEFYENVRRICCPWVVNWQSNHTKWEAFREAEAMFENRQVVLEILGRDTPLELAFGVSAIASLAEAGELEHHLSYPEYAPMHEDDFDAARFEAFSGLSDAISIIALGRQLKNMPETRPVPENKLEEYRRRLNKSAAEKRNEPFRQLHWEFRRYLAENNVKSIRNGAKLFYESLPEDNQIYQSLEHAVRNLSESVYRRRS